MSESSIHNVGKFRLEIRRQNKRIMFATSASQNFTYRTSFSMPFRSHQPGYDSLESTTGRWLRHSCTQQKRSRMTICEVLLVSFLRSRSSQSRIKRIGSDDGRFSKTVAFHCLQYIRRLKTVRKRQFLDIKRIYGKYIAMMD